MKLLSKPLIMLLLCLTTAVSYSQTVKSTVFSQFPDVIDCTDTEFRDAFASKKGETVVLSFPDNLKIIGKVISNIQKYSNLQSMTIVATEYANAIFHLSKQTNNDGSFSFVGRILSTEAKDGYEIIQNSTGSYSLKKIEEELLRQLCNY